MRGDASLRRLCGDLTDALDAGDAVLPDDDTPVPVPAWILRRIRAAVYAQREARAVRGNDAS